MCQFECCFIGFGVGVIEEDLVGEGSIDKYFGQMQDWFIGVVVVGMLEFVGLVGQGLYQMWMGMFQCVYGDVVGKIDIFFVLLILQL